MLLRTSSLLGALGLVLVSCGDGSTSRQANQSRPAIPTDSVQSAGDALDAADTTPAVSVATDPTPVDTGPELVRHGVCPFECCQYGQWHVLSVATLRALPTIQSDSVGAIISGDTVRADSGVVILRPTGLAVILLPRTQWQEGNEHTFEEGDTVELLEETGEGFRKVRLRGRELHANVDDWDDRGSSQIRIIRRPVSKWWVHITHLRSGVSGWVLMDTVRVLGADACG